MFKKLKSLTLDFKQKGCDTFSSIKSMLAEIKEKQNTSEVLDIRVWHLMKLNRKALKLRNKSCFPARITLNNDYEKKHKTQIKK